MYNFTKKYTEFILERSKNDAIQELTIIDKPLAIFIFGAPSVGKSSYIYNKILPKITNKDIKIFSSDNISYLYTKDKDVYKKGTSKLSMKYLNSYINTTNKSFIYDTTSILNKEKEEIINLSKEKGYTVIFITLITDLETNIQRDKSRDRYKSEEFIKDLYTNMWENINLYKSLNPDYYYLITTLTHGNIYNYYKYDLDTGELKTKKGDKYI